MMIGGQLYRAVDDGRGNVLVPIHDPRKASELGQRREGYNRALAMTKSPLGAGAYGVASALGASPRTQDRALAIGQVADAVLSQATPRGTFGFSRARPPKKALEGPSLERESFRLGELTPTGQATYMSMTASKPMLEGGTRADRKLHPPGWLGHGRKFNQGRGHLRAKQLGGTGEDMRNIVTLTQNPTNSSTMKRFENQVARKVRSGEIVEYFVRPLYNSPHSAPSAILMMEQGSRGTGSATIIQNPTGSKR